MVQLVNSALAFSALWKESAEGVRGTGALVSKVEKWGKLFAAEMKSGERSVST